MLYSTILSVSRSCGSKQATATDSQDKPKNDSEQQEQRGADDQGGESGGDKGKDT